MQDGTIVGSIDLAQVVLYAFWIFFAGLIFYLRREDKREGYPLLNERSGLVTVQGFPSIPAPKTFRLTHGGTSQMPNYKNDRREVRAAPVAPWPGAPLHPIGDPMLSEAGPGSYAERDDEPELLHDGRPSIVPLRVATEAGVESRDKDPRGMTVYGADKVAAGTVVELWIDRSEPQVRYLEVEVPAPAGARRVLLPITFAKINGSRGIVTVRAILARHFADVPALRSAEQVTKLEEDKITAYFAAGTLYATPLRMA